MSQLATPTPVPLDDGVCHHLPGFQLPSLPLASTAERTVDLATLPDRTVVFCYPQTAPPEVVRPPGWDGCTPQACAYRDHYQAFQRQGVRVFGLSTQTTAYQQEAVQRLRLPYKLLSDGDFVFITALQLPTVRVEGTRFVRRLTLMVRDGRIEQVWYPVVPARTNAEEVLKWLAVHPV